jgi:cytoskeletal protein RodZ
MAGMNDQRKDQSGIVVGCVVVGMLLAIVALGLVVFGGWRELQERRAMMTEKMARLSQEASAEMSAITDEEKATSPQETTQPVVK